MRLFPPAPLQPKHIMQESKSNARVLPAPTTTKSCKPRSEPAQLSVLRRRYYSDLLQNAEKNVKTRCKPAQLKVLRRRYCSRRGGEPLELDVAWIAKSQSRRRS